MLWWVMAIIWVGTTILSALLARKPADAQASAIGDFSAPTAEEGRAIPWVAGTVMISAPNVVWYGDLKSVPIKTGMGWMGFGKTVVTGNKYYLGMQLALCHGIVDELIELRADNGTKTANIQSRDVIAGDGGEDRIRCYVHDEQLFGGEKAEGGLNGFFSFYRGLQSQVSSAYLSAHLTLPERPTWRSDVDYHLDDIVAGSDNLLYICILAPGRVDPTLPIFGTFFWTLFTEDAPNMPAPAYRGLCYVVIEQMYLGTSNFLKTLDFVIRRCPDPFAQGDTVANILGDANPALMIYDLMTNPVLGLCTPAGRFDVDSFKACAVTLATEQMGMSMQIDTAAAADQLITDICRHVDAVLYTDPATGLWTMKLARADYDPDTLPEFTPDDVAEITDWTRGSWEDTVNEVKIEFTNGTTFQPDMVQAQETANYAVRNELASQTLPFHGFTKRALAQFVAMRELKGFSYPFIKIAARMNRRAWSLRMGQPFKLTWPPLGITALVCRVTHVDYGTLEDGTIVLDAVEDIFGLQYAAYVPPSDSVWEDPITLPPPPIAQELVEAPYAISGDDRYVLTLVTRGDSLSTDYQTWVAAGAGTFLGNTNDGFTPSALLAADCALADDGFTVNSAVDLDRCVSTDDAGLTRGANLLQIDDELIAWQTITDNLDGTFTLATLIRGAYDTFPADHTAGARVWFVSDGVGTTQRDPYADDLTVSCQNLPENSKGVCDPSLVPFVSITTDSRALRPYAPAHLRVNGLRDPVTTVGDATLTWANRNRVSQGQTVVGQDDPSWPGGVEGNYHIVAKVGIVTFVDAAGVTGNSYAVTGAARATVADPGEVTLTITAVNGALTSATRTLPLFTMTGFGLRFGDSFGGLNA